MLTVWKYEFAVKQLIDIDLPKGAEILKIVSLSTNFLTLWAKVDTKEQETEKHSLAIIGTGRPWINASAYLDTVFDGPYVWHIWRV